MSRRHAYALTLALSSSWLLASCSDSSKKAPAVHAPPAVTVAKVVKQSVPIVMSFSGTIKPVMAIEVIPRVSGFVEKRHFVEGTHLAEGDPMYQIDPRTYQAVLQEAQAKLQSDQASLVLYEAELARYEKAGTTGAVSKEQIDQTRAMEQEAAAAVKEDEASIESAKLDLEFTDITAPFAGRVDQTRIDVGGLATGYQSVLTLLTQLDPIYAIFNVSRADFFQVQRLIEEGVAKSALSDFEVRVTLPDGSEYPHPGKLDFVSDTIDPSTDTMTARAVMPNPIAAGGRHDLVPGQYVPLQLNVGNRDALLIPAQAVVQVQSGFQVYVVDAKSVVAARAVTLGKSHGAQRIIATGLQVGEQVVVEGVQKVRPGKPVTPSPYEAAAPAPASTPAKAPAKAPAQSGG